MRVRPRCLSAGWYPEDAKSLDQTIASWNLPRTAGSALAVLAPHAGWSFSGRLAALAWSKLAPVETVAVIGGHRAGRMPLLYASDEAFETPHGILASDGELLRELLPEFSNRGLRSEVDHEMDNTVEVQLPFAAYYLPKARILWLRAPSGETAIAMGQALFRVAARCGRSIAIVASSDLTHYGPDYDFEPAEARADPLSWVRDRNDQAYLDALLALDAPTSLARAHRDRSACSAGAAAAALGFALETGVSRAELLGYATSYERRPAPSFVGYAALGFFP